MKTSEKVQALLYSHVSAYRIAKDTGISVSTILGLRSGDRQLLSITLGTAEKLANYWEKIAIIWEEKFMKNKLSVLIASLSVVAGMGLTTASASTYTQKGSGLSNYWAAKFHTVKNANNYVARPSYVASPNYAATHTFETSANHYVSKAGNTKASLNTAFYLPVTLNQSGDFGNPQSVAITPNGNGAYVAYVTNEASSIGWVTYYNLAKLRNVYGASTSNIALIRQAAYAHSKGIKNNGQYLAVLKSMKVGPEFNTGHIQSLALNPKNGQLWFTKTTGRAGAYGTAEQVSTKSLKPINKINFRLVTPRGIKVTVGNNLTFDKQGKAYFSSYVGGSRAMKIYQGTIAPKKVHFRLLYQGLRQRPGEKNQSIGYNAANNRLYFISDDSISSVSDSKLVSGKLKPGNVHSSVFSSKREFEGLAFSKNGQGYLLTNRGGELLSTNGL